MNNTAKPQNALLSTERNHETLSLPQSKPPMATTTTATQRRPPTKAGLRNFQKRKQHQQQAFRQKVVTSNANAICTTTSLKVGRRTLRQLMHPTKANNQINTNASASGVHEAYRVPIFQRRYCWNTPQWDTMWNDISKPKSCKHSLGRLTCTNVAAAPNQNKENHQQKDVVDHQSSAGPNRSIIIDGQQRFTTITLILAAIRDSLVSLQNPSRECQNLIQSIHEMLFLDPSAMEQWVRDNTTTNNNNSALTEGLELEFCRLIPTFCDRNAYLAAILPPSAPQVQVFLAQSYNPKWHRPLLAKQHYARKIRSLLCSSDSKDDFYVLNKLTRSLLDNVDMLHFPIDVDRGYVDGTEDTQVIYERLAIRDATWCKPSRSTEYQSMDGTDMIRNLCLGSFESAQQKETFYQSLWLPLERLVIQQDEISGYDCDNNNKSHEEKSLETILWAFLDHHQSSTTPMPLANTTGVIGGSIYREFESFMAADFEDWREAQSDPALPNSLLPFEAHTTSVGKRLLKFAKDYLK